MKVVAFNGSARAKGNTAILLNVVLDELRKEGIETELVTLAGKVTLVSPEQSSNAASPILVTLLGMVTLVSFAPPANA